jgi:flagellar hook protein FlgE
MNADATENIFYDGNLNAAVENELTTNPSKIQVEDAGSGLTDNVSVSLEETDNFNQWKFNLTADDATSTFDYSTGYLTLDDEGNVVEITENKDGTGQDLTADNPTIDIGASGNTVDLNMPSVGDDLSSASLFKGAGAAGEEIIGSYESVAKRTINTSVFDSQGVEHTVGLIAKKVSDNNWIIKEEDVDVSEATIADNDSDGVADWLGGSDHIISFDSGGNIVAGGSVELTFDPNGGASSGQTLNLDFSDFTQFAGDMTADYDTADGYPQGDLQSFTIDGSGSITGSYDNGYNKTLAKIGIANFSNPAGLSREGDSLFNVSNNSGDPQVGLAGTGGKGMIAPGTLEMSNVDLAQQFTEMITAQRGFQSNSKIISTSDEMLQTLVNLKR